LCHGSVSAPLGSLAVCRRLGLAVVFIVTVAVATFLTVAGIVERRRDSVYAAARQQRPCASPSSWSFGDNRNGNRNRD